jgi:tripartite-type tricarboxylate transporter receptor subunit TctC
MRALAESAGKALGGQFIVDNKAGASGMLGPNELVNAAPDGYTLSQITIGVARLPHMQKMQFDPLKDFTYIACSPATPLASWCAPIRPSRASRTWWTLPRPTPANSPMAPPATAPRPTWRWKSLHAKAGIKLQHIPFKGNADGMQAVLGGHVMSHSDATGWGPHVDAGTCRLLATYGSKRTKRWPNVPTLQELGYETLADSPFGIGGPKGMPAALTSRLHDAFKKTPTRRSPRPTPPACAARTSGSCRCWSWAARQTPPRAAP